ncbi:hypothetical protein BVRB_9g226060 [Beta vulgaris subsp. vulgaris]|uniref:Uncharacterized protein n=1 Tax=Beta vulgaris subsp. vulgaris TaxID=3555 RepID=A0A0J8DZN7_BETVV|nr:hypothetical protein BVRB_9g226060 [Beta vulgaris subsp. vulgaris]
MRSPQWHEMVYVINNGCKNYKDLLRRQKHLALINEWCQKGVDSST